MKKIIPLLALLVWVLSFSACEPGNTADDPPLSERETEPDIAYGIQENQTDAESIVVYFSCTGHTEAVAQNLAQETGSDLYEIVPEEPYTEEDLDYNNPDARASLEMNDTSSRPAIGGDSMDLSGYQTVFLGYPIWWGTMPRIINTFLDSYDLSDKTILPFCTSGSSDISQSVSDIKKEEPDSDIRDGLRVSGPDDEAIVKWLNENGFAEQKP